MKRILVALLACFLVAPIFADSGSSANSTFPVTNWISKNSTDPVTIQNGAGTPILIAIYVIGSSNDTPGVSVANCGSTTHINPGNTSICDTSDSLHPVTLASDSASIAARGTYQIKPK